MDTITSATKNPVFRMIKWIVFILIIAYVLLVIGRVFHFFNLDKTNAEVERIHNTKLTLADVMGDDLPPDPGETADDTVAGIDANENGIRDDVELAIFREYPDSAKTRAVLLQYALALQTQVTLPVVNKETVTATVEDTESRALNCIWSITSRDDMEKFMEITEKNENFVKQNQFNTDERRKHNEDFYKYLGSYSVSQESCDLDLSTLSN